MAQNGLFRNAMGGFNKQDVLQYIDGITAEWDAERTILNQQAAEANSVETQLRAEAEQAQAQAAEAVAAAEEARQKAQVSETQLAEVQQQLYDAEADLANYRNSVEELTAQWEEAQRRIAQLEQELNEAAQQRDDAIAAVADAKAQLAATGDLAGQLEESRHLAQRQSDQIDAMQQAINRYEQVLGTAEDTQEQVKGIVQPFLEQANKQADETLDSVQAVLAGVLAQLGELQGSVEQRRQALQRCKEDSNTRLTAAFGDWLDQAKDVATPDRHFFR